MVSRNPPVNTETHIQRYPRNPQTQHTYTNTSHLSHPSLRLKFLLTSLTNQQRSLLIVDQAEILSANHSSHNNNNKNIHKQHPAHTSSH